MKTVRIIPTIPKENIKLRVAAYCRVSTYGPAQIRSLELQIKTTMSHNLLTYYVNKFSK